MNTSKLLPRALIVCGLGLLAMIVWSWSGGNVWAQTPPGAEPTPVEPRPVDPQPKEPTPKSETPAGDESPPSITLDLSNPRGTMHTFLVAVQDAANKPERIDDAVKCLDTSGLSEAGREERARTLARQLAELIATKGITLDDLPESPDGDEYAFYRLPAGEFEPTEDQPNPPEIRLARAEDGKTWLFTPSTLASISALQEAFTEKAEPPPTIESGIPHGRSAPRATMSTFIVAMNAKPQDLATAVRCLDPTGRNPEAWSVTGKDLAAQLKIVMDKTKEVVLVDLPDSPTGPPYVWFTNRAGDITLKRVDEVPQEWDQELVVGEWRFSPQTLRNIGALYDEYRDEQIVETLRAKGVEETLTWSLWLDSKMPEQLRAKVLGLEGWKWSALVVLVLAGWLLGRGVAFGAGILLTSAFRRRRIAIDPQVQRRGLRSTGAVAAVLFWYFAVQFLALPDACLNFLLPVLKFLLTVMAVWCGYRIVDVIGGYIARNKEIRLSHFDEMLVPLLRTLLRVLVVIVVILFVLHYWFDTPPTTVLGALGIGGVALAFAAKDTLGNFFGSLTVLFDRPFAVGDWIVMGDVDGTVEHVGFRSTRVRTFYNSIITVPNAKMVDSVVDNYGARRYRRAKVMISIQYSTPPERIDAFCEGIRELIRLHPYTRKDYYHVYFNQFAASALDILLYVFFEVPDWSTELRERHRLFVDIVRLAHDMGIEFAFPTQTVWLHRGEKTTGAPPFAGPHVDPDEVGIDRAAEVFKEAYGTPPAYRGPVKVEPTPQSKRER